MKKNYFKLLSLVVSIIGLSITNYSFSQSVAINSSGNVAHSTAGLDVSFTNKGVLIPRVALTGDNVAGPIGSTPATSLLVYNTATVTGANAVTPGYYYWNGSKWVRLITSDDLFGSFWKTDGNAGTNITNNFIGTTDNNGLMVRTNNANRFEFNTSGQILGNTTGSAAAPTYGWRSNLTNGPSTGMFRSGSTRLGFTVKGDHILDLLSNTSGVQQILSQIDGAEDRPAYSFESSVYSGMWTPGSNILAFSTNQNERMRILQNAGRTRVFINNTTGVSPDTGILTLIGSANDDGIISSVGGTGDAIYAQNLGAGDAIAGWSVNYAGVVGITLGNDAGVYGGAIAPVGFGGFFSNEDPSGIGLFVVGEDAALSATDAAAVINGETRGTVSYGHATDGVGIVGAGNGITGFNYLTDGSGGAFNGTEVGSYSKATAAASGTGVIGVGNNSGTVNALTDGSGGAFSGTNTGAYAKGNTASSTGVVGVGNNTTSIWTLTNGSGGAFTGNTTGVYGHANNANGTGVFGRANASDGIGVAGEGTGLDGVGVQGQGDYAGVVGVGDFAGVQGEGEVGVLGAANDPNLDWAGFFIGNVFSTGSYLGSDIRWKKNIQEIETEEEKGMLSKIMQLEPRQYNWKADEFPGMNFDPNRTSYGFIAQDLEKVFPDLVTSEKPILDPTVDHKIGSSLQGKESVQKEETVKEEKTAESKVIEDPRSKERTMEGEVDEKALQSKLSLERSATTSENTRETQEAEQAAGAQVATSGVTSSNESNADTESKSNKSKRVSGYYTVDYVGLIPVLVQGIQEQQHIIEAQNAKIQAQDEKIERLERMLNDIQEKLEK